MQSYGRFVLRVFLLTEPRFRLNMKYQPWLVGVKGKVPLDAGHRVEKA